MSLPSHHKYVMLQIKQLSPTHTNALYDIIVTLIKTKKFALKSAQFMFLSRNFHASLKLVHVYKIYLKSYNYFHTIIE